MKIEIVRNQNWYSTKDLKICYYLCSEETIIYKSFYKKRRLTSTVSDYNFQNKSLGSNDKKYQIAGMTIVVLLRSFPIDSTETVEHECSIMKQHLVMDVIHKILSSDVVSSFKIFGYIAAIIWCCFTLLRMRIDILAWLKRNAHFKPWWEKIWMLAVWYYRLKNRHLISHPSNSRKRPHQHIMLRTRDRHRRPRSRLVPRHLVLQHRHTRSCRIP